MNNIEIRNSYNEMVTNAYKSYFSPKFKEIHDQDMCFGEDLAREAFEARDYIKSLHQEETSMIGNFVIGVRNLYKYGSWSNPGYDYFAKFKTPEEIAYSAFKTNGSDLGLANNGFGEVYSQWKDLHEDNPELYPEYMVDYPVETLDF